MPSQAANRRIATLVGIAAPILLVTNFAFAAWTATGSGSAQANAGTATAMTVTVGTVTATADVLYPNNDGNIRLTITNTNPYAVDIEALTFTTITASGACTTHGVTFDNIADLNKVVGANGSLNVQLVDKAHMSNASTSDCQGSTFTAPVAVTGASTAAEATANDF